MKQLKLYTAILSLFTFLITGTINAVKHTIRNNTGTYTKSSQTTGQVTVPVDVYQQNTGELILVNFKVDTGVKVIYTDPIALNPDQETTVDLVVEDSDITVCIIGLKVNGKGFTFDKTCNSKAMVVTGKSPNLQVKVNNN